ncbi:hypothetical protein FG99_04170 [Pseudomonas sp. AAC]|nr:hypothetical protein FG99_04170 [Pseudomonas sp. AAC]
MRGGLFFCRSEGDAQFLLANEVTGGFGAFGGLRTLSPALSLKGEGASPRREKAWFQPETFGVAG